MVHLALAALEHQEIIGQFKVTWITLFTIAHSHIVHAIVLEAYIHFSFMYTTDHIFPVLPIKYLLNEYVEPTTPYKPATGTKTAVSNLHILFCPCIVRISTTHVGPKA